MTNHMDFGVLFLKARGHSVYVPGVLGTGREPLGNSH